MKINTFSGADVECENSCQTVHLTLDDGRGSYNAQARLSPQQARQLARELQAKADEIEGVQPIVFYEIDTVAPENYRFTREEAKASGHTYRKVTRRKVTK